MVLKGVVNFPFAIKRILGIKRIFPCSFENKRMRLLTRVYGISLSDRNIMLYSEKSLRRAVGPCNLPVMLSVIAMSRQTHIKLP